MERLTIDGGEVWLGFARNRVKAFRRAGIRYTRQVFEMPDKTRIIIELAGKDHTIRLSGVVLPIISGVVRGGKPITLPPTTPGAAETKVLRDFKPTADAAKKIFNKPDMAKQFGDVQQLLQELAAEKSPNVFNTGIQVGNISPGLYSGMMKQVIQILLGLKEQVKINYTYSFEDTYGICKATDGSHWLVRISKEHGVLAVPLKLSKKTAGNRTKAVTECAKLFGGIPTGEDFPKDIEKAVNSIEILRLLDKVKLGEFYKKEPWFESCGWSFNNSGSEAHNTCFLPGGTSEQEYGCSYHYKITINITKQGNTLGLGYAGNAELSVVNSYRLETYKIYERVLPLPSITFTEYSSSGVGQKGVWGRGIKLFEKRAYDNPTIGPIYILVGHREDGSLFKAGYRGETEHVFDAYTTTAMGDVVEQEEAFAPNMFATVEGEPKFGKWVGKSSRSISHTKVAQVETWTTTNVKYAAAKWHHQSEWWGDRLWHTYWPDYSGAVSIMNTVVTNTGDISKAVYSVRRVAFEGIHVKDYPSAFGASLTMLPGIRDSFVLFEKRPRHLIQDGIVTHYGNLYDYGQGNHTYKTTKTPLVISSWDNDPFVTYPPGASLFYIGPAEGSTYTVSRKYDPDPPPDPPYIEQPELFKLRMEPRSLANEAEEAIGSMCFENNGREQLSIMFGTASMSYFGAKNTVLTFSTGSDKYPTKFRTIVSGDLVSELEKQPEKAESYFFVGCT